MKSGVQEIAEERAGHRYSPAHDDAHADGELAVVAAGLVLSPWWSNPPVPVDWGQELVEKHSGNRIKQLRVAGSLIAAEIDRLKRQGTPAVPDGWDRTVPPDSPRLSPDWFEATG